MGQRLNSVVADAGSFVHGRWVWNLPWRRSLFQWEDVLVADLLSRLQPVSCTCGDVDGWQWILDKEGRFSVSSAYGCLSNENAHNQGSYQKIWNSFIPFKVSALMWKIILGRLPTKVALRHRNVIPLNASVLCGFCRRRPETVDHLFLNCEFAQWVWHGCYKWALIAKYKVNDIFHISDPDKKPATMTYMEGYLQSKC
ncbi:hypothetical protein RIF29_22173 [Crotalaria pallida]|uniref:Reverse transcriptase zinc-binding domain-containing protein n=1 Tax=Crotalaria pallida TaxID=3830 RepID=A0AAN9F3W7_CROPI